MDAILKYLMKPMEVGVRSYRFIIDFSNAIKYLKDFSGNVEQQLKELRGVSRMRLQRGLQGIGDALESIDGVPVDSQSFFLSLLSGISWCVYHTQDASPERLKRAFLRGMRTRMPDGSARVIYTRVGTRPMNLFESHVDDELQDAVVIEKKHLEHNRWLFDITTVRDETIAELKQFLEVIPTFKESISAAKESRHFSQRFVYRVYPYAVEIWLKHEVSASVPADLRSFISGAIRYYNSNEWRTSIVISAITVESMLGDIFEEKRKTQAPDVPLGDLFRQVTPLIDLPAEITAAVSVVNEARIAAVHRSRYPVSDREAMLALFGVINLALWYYSNMG